MANKKLISLLIALLIFCSPLSIGYNRASANLETEYSVPVIFDFDRQNTYENYRLQYQSEASPVLELVIPGSAYTSHQNTSIGTFQGRNNVMVWDGPNSWAEWNIEVAQAGLYTISIEYCIPENSSRDVELELLLDGKLLFNEAKSNYFYRLWMDETDIMQDVRGNDIRPRQIIVPNWQEAYFKDHQGLHNDVFSFYLKRGINVLTLKSHGAAFAMDKIRVHNKPELQNYAQVLASYNEKGYKATSSIELRHQAEDTYLKSDSTLHPIFDRSSPLTEPYDAAKLRLNTIGGANWKSSGQRITWKIDVEEDGLYNIGIKFRQSLLQGLFTSRKIYINGEVPFKELLNVRFPYRSTWQMKVLGDEDPFLFYLREGPNEIAMEVVLGDITDSIRILDESVFEMNNLYRRIIMITSSRPDPYRDYFLDTRIPELIPTLLANADRIGNEAAKLKETTGRDGSETALLERIAYQMRDLANRPETIQLRLDNYKSNVSALAAWLLKVKEQPLELDYFSILSSDVKPPNVKPNIFQTIMHRLGMFWASFFEDYDSIGDVQDSSQAIKVWVGTGRDQAQIIKGMIDDLFTPQTGIIVNLELVQGALIEATLAGRGPDIAMTVGNEQPINFALRGALVDLAQFEDFEEVSQRFFPSAMVPYHFRGQYFALPEKQNYNMMFYRKDIFADLGLGVPQTWEEFYKIVPVIQRNNMQIGLPQQPTTSPAGTQTANLFAALLFQYGGSYYKENMRETGFDTDETLNAFREWTGFYTKYDFPFTYDFYNRFRTGEMPIGIQPYSEFNRLSVAAPEIHNLWEMVPIPGVVMTDGSINRSQGAAGAATVMFKGIKDEYAGWEFLKWWTSAEAQARFGLEMESLMGAAARYDTANIEAFGMLPWNQRDYDNLMGQWEQVQGIPEIPGSYYTMRGLQNAFRTAVFDRMNPREALHIWNKTINEEIQRKLVEFGLE